MRTKLDIYVVFFVVAFLLFGLEFQFLNDRFSVVMRSMFGSSVVDREYDPRSNQIKENTVSILCFSTKVAALTT